MRPIDADELLKASRIGKILYFNDTTTDGYTDVLLAVEVEHAPTIEAEPVRHGEWLDSGINGTVSCSLCMFTDFFAKQNRVMLFKYCPGCGARMVGGDNST